MGVQTSWRKCFYISEKSSNFAHRKKKIRKSMKRLLITLFAICIVVPSTAVLKERDLSTTLKVLRVELRKAWDDQQVLMKRIQTNREAQHKEMVSLMERSAQVSLMLYSQKPDYTFDLTFACGEATSLYREFTRKRRPYDRIMQRLNIEVERYDNLIKMLQLLPPSLVQATNQKPAANDSLRQGPPELAKEQKRTPIQLDAESQKNRLECLDYATKLRENISKMKEETSRDDEHYKRITEQLKKLHDYAQKRYHEIQQNIFINGESSYFTTIANMPRHVKRAHQDATDKYDDKDYRGTHTEWRGPIVFGFVFFIVFYLVLSVLLANLVVRFLFRKVKRLKTENLQLRKASIIIAASVFFFILSIMIARTFMYHDFLKMATELLVEYAWLLLFVSLSLLIRLSGDQIKSGFSIYMPILIMGLVVIVFRIVFIPNYIVTLIFPPLLVIFTLWQWWAISRHNDNIPKSDIFYTWISLAVMGLSCVMAWMGYVLLSVQVLIWWLFQLTAIQAVTCFFDLLSMYSDKYLKKSLRKFREKHKALTVALNSKIITVTWLFDFIRMVIVPVVGVYSVLYCIFLSSDVFDLSDTCFVIFFYEFLNIPDVISLSLFKIVVVVAAFFLFRYINYLCKSLIKHYKTSVTIKQNGGKLIRRNQINLMLINNVTSIIVWGIYIIAAIILLKIPKSGISIVTAGLATGIGFAMKDTINNFFYGVSLMAGRIRVGDYIECDGIQGKVESITYQSTQIITLDGAVMAILNSSLFSKNFKNLTRNHSYELVKIPVGVAYGTNIDEVRKMLVDELTPLNYKDKFGRWVVDQEKGFSVLFKDFGESSVDLYVAFWIIVSEKVQFMYKVRETIYKTLNANKVVIPFPQRDLHIMKE